jgi:hypothetical protein
VLDQTKSSSRSGNGRFSLGDDSPRNLSCFLIPSSLLGAVRG